MSPSGRCSGLTADGVELTEVAPGIDIRADILERMRFQPIRGKPRP